MYNNLKRLHIIQEEIRLPLETKCKREYIE